MDWRLFTAALVLCWTSAALAEEQPKATTRVYAVADLVVEGPVESSWLHNYFNAIQRASTAELVAAGGPAISAPQVPPVEDNLTNLAEVLQSAIDGFGTLKVTPHIRTRSLVIRAQPAVHDEIVGILEHLRRIGNEMVDIRIELIRPKTQPEAAEIQQASSRQDAADTSTSQPTFTEEWVTEHGHCLSPEQLRQFRRQAGENDWELFSVGGGTVHSGYSLDFFSDDFVAIVTATSSRDRRHVRAVLTSHVAESLFTNTSIQIPTGHGVIHPMMADNGERLQCLITAEVQIIEEEEEVASDRRGQ